MWTHFLTVMLHGCCNATYNPSVTWKISQSQELKGRFLILLISRLPSRPHLIYYAQVILIRCKQTFYFSSKSFSPALHSSLKLFCNLARVCAERRGLTELEILWFEAGLRIWLALLCPTSLTRGRVVSAWRKVRGACVVSGINCRNNNM